MKAKNVALTAFLLAPIVVVVILVWLIAMSIDRQGRALEPGPGAAPANRARPPGG